MTLTDLYEQYENELERYATRLTRDPHWADDLVQEAFIRAMGHLDLLALLKPYQRRAWFYRTLKNLFLDQTRSHQRQEALVEALAWDVPAAGYLPQEVVSPSPFDLVPERHRELVEKRFIYGMTSQEIAEELGIPAVTVRSRLHLAIKALRARQQELR